MEKLAGRLKSSKHGGNRVRADFHFFADNADRSSISLHPLNLSDLRFRRRLATKTHPALFRFTNANDLTLFADRVLELAEDPQKLKEHRSHRGRGVDCLLVAEDIDLAVLQLGQHENEISHRPPQAINGPNHDLFELTQSGIVNHALQLWAIFSRFRPADLLAVDLNDLPARSLSESVKLFELTLVVLIDRRHSCVDRNLHFQTPLSKAQK